MNVIITRLKALKRGLSRVRHGVRIGLSYIMYRASLQRGRDRKHLQLLKDRHQGRRAFVICNGPSLRADDLEMLAKHKEISIASNKIDKIYGQTSWRPAYYIVSDEGFQFSLKDSMNNTPAEVKFFRAKSYLYTRNVKGRCVWLNGDGSVSLLDNPQFASDITDKIYAIATVTYMQLQILVHMGIREIYIIGCDNSYGREMKKDGTIIDHGKSSHFYAKEGKKGEVIAATWQMNLAYDFARHYADEHGIKIYNATRGGYLEAFERVDFDSLFCN